MHLGLTEEETTTSVDKLVTLLREHGSAVLIRERVKLFGLIPMVRNRGWLWIEDCDSHWNVAIANGKTSHNRGRNRFISADFRKDTGTRWTLGSCLTGAWHQVISVWPVREEAEAIAIFERVSHHIDLAYRYHYRTQRT